MILFLLSLNVLTVTLIYWKVKINAIDPLLYFWVAIVGAVIFIINSFDIIGTKNSVYISLVSEGYLAGYFMAYVSNAKTYKLILAKVPSRFICYKSQWRVESFFYFNSLICMVVVGAISIFFFLLILASGMGGSYRVVLASIYPFLYVVNTGLSIALSVFLPVLFYIFGSKYWKLIVVYCLIVLLSGSKASLISFAIQMLFFQSLLSSKKFNFFKVFIIILSSTLVMLPIITIMNDISIIDAINLFLYRLIAFGDGYVVLFTNDSVISYLNNLYNPVEYVFHPILRVFKLTDSYASIGSMLGGVKDGAVTGVGPNPLLPIILSVFTMSNTIISIIIAFFIGAVSFYIRFIFLRFFLSISSSFMILSFMLFITSFAIYSDIQLFQTNIISLFAMYLMMLFVYNIYYTFSYNRFVLV